MKEYKYPRYMFGRLSGKLGLVVMVLIIPMAFVMGMASRGQILAGVMFALIFAIFDCVAAYVLNMRPNIECDDEGLFIDFLGGPIEIPWTDVLGITQVYGMPQKVWLVRAKKITFLHYFYGLQFFLEWVPGFLIWENISNRDELLSEIRKKRKSRKP